MNRRPFPKPQRHYPHPKCILCPDLIRSRSRIVWGEPYTLRSSDTPQVMVIAEAPGVEEDKCGSPLVGNGGQEARHHLDINGITSKGVWLDNIVKCRPEGNRDPLTPEIAACTDAHLIPTILQLQPKWIITMGRTATRYFLGSVDMEMVHGIPRTINFMGLDTIIIPAYHPAAGLHDQSQMILFHSDMVVAGGVVRGKIDPHPPVDTLEGQEDYREITDRDPFPIEPGEYPLVAVDTEWARGRPFCLSFSFAPGSSFVIRHDQQYSLGRLNTVLGYGDTTEAPTTIIHNALYDLPVLAEMGIVPAQTTDTMVMAYLLQNEPQGLKPLAFRHCGMKMAAYREMVGDATIRMAMDYLQLAAVLDWPTPKPVLEWKGGEPKVRQPQGMGRKIARILKGVEEKGADPAEKWKAIKEGKEVVEKVLGPLQEGELCDIPWDKAIYYSARDADATIRVYPFLWERIQDMGLEDTFWRDMGALPMVVDMMANGMPVDLGAFRSLSAYFQKRMDLIQRKMQLTVGHLLPGKAINPASYPQMSTLIYDQLALHEKGGRFRAKKGGKKSTADDILKRYLALHPVVQDIIDWRGYQKLKTSYADAIPRLVSPDGRIRTTLRITRTVTGRLSSSKPNLMAQPTRSEEGRKVRDCYVAGEGNVFVSGDYGQVEMRVAASESKDERMMSIFWRGDDIHSQTASMMFGIPIGNLDEMKHRYPAKRVGFGILNLITAEGLQRELSAGGADNWTVDDCKEMIRSWFDIYSGIAAYMKSNGGMARRYGYVRDMWGRLRYIAGIRSTNRWVRIEAERQAGNAPIQMGAQGIIKEAMSRLVPIYPRLGALPLIQIHDDIVWEVAEDKLDKVVPEIKRVMESSAPADFIVPLTVDFKVGRKWGSMNKWK